MGSIVKYFALWKVSDLRALAWEEEYVIAYAANIYDA